MGQASRRRAEFFARHPYWAFCGGETPATTFEHCPPRSLFLYKQWPEGFEFPSCDSCNTTTGDADALVALLARTSTSIGRDDEDSRFLGLLKNVNTQFPGIVHRMMPSATEARRLNRELGITLAPGQTHQEASPLRLPPEVQQVVGVFGAKLGKAVFYQQTGRVFPKVGCLLMRWFTNANVLRDGGIFKLFESLASLPGTAPSVERSGKHLNDQFQYRVSLADQNEFIVLQAMFNNAFGLVVIASPVAGKLETLYLELNERHGHDGLFAVLQSPTIL